MGMIDGKVAIVTGSGRGIGAASAKKLGAEGASIVVSDIDPAPAEETVAAIREAGGRAIAVVGDVTDPAFPSRLIEATLAAFDGLDIIVNSAGYTWDAVMQNMTDKQWYAMLDVHTTAPFRILREAFVSFIRHAAKKEHAANGAANPVQQGPMRLLVDARVPTVRRMLGDEIGQDLRDRWRVGVRAYLGVVSHWIAAPLELDMGPPISVEECNPRDRRKPTENAHRA